MMKKSMTMRKKKRMMIWIYKRSRVSCMEMEVSSEVKTLIFQRMGERNCLERLKTSIGT